MVGGAGEQQHRRVAEAGVGRGDRERASIPHPDEPDPEPFPQAGLGERAADEIGADRAGLGDLETGETADYVALPTESERAGRHRRAEDFTELDDVVGAGDLQDVDRCGRVGARHDLDLRRDLPDGERDVGVGLIILGGHHHRCLTDTGVVVGDRVVERADHHGATLVVQAAREFHVVDDDDIGHLGLVGLLDEVLLDRPDRGEDHVAGRRRRKCPWRTPALTFVHPRDEHELDEHERQHHQQERRT